MYLIVYSKHAHIKLAFYALKNFKHVILKIKITPRSQKLYSLFLSVSTGNFISFLHSLHEYPLYMADSEIVSDSLSTYYCEKPVLFTEEINTSCPYIHLNIYQVPSNWIGPRPQFSMVNFSAEDQSEDIITCLINKVSVFEIVYVSLYCQSFVI